MPTPIKSAEMHELSGTKSNAKEAGDSPLISGRPKPPQHLTKPERAEFKKLVRQLEARGHATPGDFGMLAVLATATVRWLAEKKDLDTRGPFITIQVPDGSGTGGTIEREIENPSRKNSVESEKQIAALYKEMGLTARARDCIKRAARPVLAPVEEFNPLGKLV